MRPITAMLAILIVTHLAVSTACAQPETDSPGDVEFVTQRLSPTDATCERPKDWFYAETHEANALTWTISREDTRGDQPYTVGLKTEVRSDVSQTTGASPQKNAAEFLESLGKADGVKVLGTTKERTMGPLRSVVMVTEQGDFHIEQTVCWGTGKYDVLIYTTAKAPKDLWGTHKATFSKVGRCDLSKLVGSAGKNKSKPQKLSSAALNLQALLSGKGYEVVSLERLKTGHLVVSAQINDGDEMRFLCDSGANRTILTPETCRSLKLETSATTGTTIGASGQSMKTVKTKVASFQIGKSKVSFSKVLVVDLSQLNKQIVSGGGKPIAGIVGSDWMQARNALIDMGSGRLFYKLR